MDYINFHRAFLNNCPTLASRKIFWGIKDMSYLGLGNALFLNFIRWLVLAFFLIALLSLYSILIFSDGPRYTLNTFGLLEYAVTHSSIANLGSETWTAAGESYCENGFHSRVCDVGGWGNSTSAFSHQCGKVDNELLDFSTSASKAIIGALEVSCVKPIDLCYCMQGWTGPTCSERTSDPIIHNGWCTPVNEYWLIEDSTAKAQAKSENEASRLEDVCSGHGYCYPRLLESNTSVVRYNFCRCDIGYYGDNCQFKESTDSTFGDFYNHARGRNNTEKCNNGTIPFISNSFFGVNFPDTRCHSHGFGIAYPVESNYSLGLSNFYRPQTPATCFCEPGFYGEECQGGAVVPSGIGWMHAVCTSLLVFFITFIYRSRKSMEREYEVQVLTSSDYSIFVNHLPTVKLANIHQVYDHFEQFGPVHFVAPALPDRKLLQLQAQRNRISTEIQIQQEKDLYTRKMEIWQADIAKAMKIGDKEAEERLKANPPSLAFVPPIQLDLPCEGWVPSLNRWVLMLSSVPMLLGLVPRAELYKILLFLDHEIAKVRAQPAVSTFARCFVTFSTIDGREKCLAAYSEKREGMFGKLPQLDPRVLYQGRHWISVSPACEPLEVQWSSLSVGPRVRALLMTLLFAVFVGVIVGLFRLILLLNANKNTGIVGVLISLTVLAINRLSAIFWINTAQAEHHYSYGASMRSCYLKMLLTQIFVTLIAGSIGVYGFPLDAKNGYIQDWYAEAGGFVFRMVLTEAIAGPTVQLLSVPYRLALWRSNRTTSATQRRLLRVPAPPVLAEHCASLMRTVIMVCTFNAGMPALNIALFFGLMMRYQAYKYCFRNIFAVRHSGPELARALELTLVLCAVCQAVMGWVVLRIGSNTNFITEVLFFLVIVGALWALSGYFSFRWCGGYDCYGGSGPLVPCSGWLCCFNERILRPFKAVHMWFMRLAMGKDFFEPKSMRSRGESAGIPFHMAAKLFRMRQTPYGSIERAQNFPELDSGEPEVPALTGLQVLDMQNSMTRRKLATVVVDDDLALVASPLVERMQKEKRLVQAAEKAAATVGLNADALSVAGTALTGRGAHLPSTFSMADLRISAPATPHYTSYSYAPHKGVATPVGLSVVNPLADARKGTSRMTSAPSSSNLSLLAGPRPPHPKMSDASSQVSSQVSAQVFSHLGGQGPSGTDKEKEKGILIGVEKDSSPLNNPLKNTMPPPPPIIVKSLPPPPPISSLPSPNTPLPPPPTSPK